MFESCAYNISEPNCQYPFSFYSGRAGMAPSPKHSRDL